MIECANISQYISYVIQSSRLIILNVDDDDDDDTDDPIHVINLLIYYNKFIINFKWFVCLYVKETKNVNDDDDDG